MNNQFIQGVTFDWDRIDNDSYLKRIEAFGGVKKLDFNKPVTFFVGENGSGKSTLLEALAVAHGFNPEGLSAMMWRIFRMRCLQEPARLYFPSLP